MEASKPSCEGQPPLSAPVGRDFDPTALDQAAELLEINVPASWQMQVDGPEAECAEQHVGEASTSSWAPTAAEDARSRTSAGRARMECTFNGANQWAASCFASAAALSAAVSVH
jgi:hypothetical protein